ANDNKAELQADLHPRRKAEHQGERQYERDKMTECVRIITSAGGAVKAFDPRHLVLKVQRVAARPFVERDSQQFAGGELVAAESGLDEDGESECQQHPGQVPFFKVA